MPDAPPLFEKMDHTAWRRIAGAIARQANEWAGLPMPIDGETLIVHPSYPYAKVFEEHGAKQHPDSPDVKVINQWRCKRLNAVIVMFEEAGKIQWAALPDNTIDKALRTMGMACVWSIEAEAAAQQKLATLVKHHTFRSYLLTGSFLETSKRSGVTYLFRRLRPTVALRDYNGSVTFLASLCLHPIGHYQDTWAGAMVPTDDVIGHLLLMRGDEHFFWRCANQSHDQNINP